MQRERAHTLRIAPLFDHGLSLMYSCMSDDAAAKFDVMEDKPCQNFIGGYSCYENLKLIEDKTKIFANKLVESDKDIIFADLQDILSEVFIDKIWDMIYKRYKVYENL